MLLCACLAAAAPARAGEFQEAAAIGDADKVMTMLIAHPELLNARDKGTTAIHEAARKGHRLVVERLIANGAELNARDISGITPLRMAIGYGHKEVAALLQKNGALDSAKTAVTNAPTVVRIEVPTNAPLVPGVLVQTNAPRIVPPVNPPSLVVRTSAPPELTPVTYSIHDLAKVGDVERIKLVLKSWPEVLEAADEKGYTPLHVAVVNDRIETAALLLSRRANPHAKTRTGQTALHFAAQKGALPMVQLLLTNGASPRAFNSISETPLLTAARAGQMDLMLVQALEEARGQVANTVPNAALNARQAAVMKVLLEAKADPNARDEGGLTPLMSCALLGNERGVELLLAGQASVNWQESKQGLAALHMAAARGHRGVIERLLDGKADANLLDGAGETPLYHALQSGRDETAALLQERGGKLPAQKPLTPLEQSLVDYHQGLEKTFQTGSATDKRRAALAMVPTKPDVEKLFPQHFAQAWKVVDQMGAEIKAALDQGGRPPANAGVVWRVLLQPPSPIVQELQRRRWLAADVPIYSLRVNRKGAMDITGGYCYVNQHWVPLPPLNRIFTE